MNSMGEKILKNNRIFKVYAKYQIQQNKTVSMFKYLIYLVDDFYCPILGSFSFIADKNSVTLNLP
jgi:hypothetical protein